MMTRANCPKGRASLGFTLIELLVSLAIMSVLALVVVPVAQLQVQHRKEQELRMALREIRTALDAYKRAVDEGRIHRDGASAGYPESLEVLTKGTEDLRDPQRRVIRFLRRIPPDPFAREADALDASAWGLRAYASEADAPAPGEDVYDVYSRSTLTGLNGVPYQKW